MKSLRKIVARQSAFTIVEVAIASVIGLMAITAAVSMFIASSKMVVTSYMQNKAAMEARMVADKLTSDVRMAVVIESSYGTHVSDPTTLILKVPSLDINGFAVDPASKFDRIVYHKDQSAPDQLKRTVYADAASSRMSGSESVASSVTPGVYTVQPDPVGEFIVYYKFTSIQKRGDKEVVVPASGSVQLRNHI